MVTSKELCTRLMHADSASEVVEALEENGYWSDPRVWRFFDDNENNFPTIGNQQSDPIAALIEKLVNSVDARLMGACAEAGIEPDSDLAPRTIRGAVAQFFEGMVPPISPDAGHASEWTDQKSTSEGLQLTLAATGYMPDEGDPSLSVADSGEGQEPDKFPDSFLSVGRKNKLRVPFVQGKHNMGGTGALLFCCPENPDGSGLQLIVSRRNPASRRSSSPRASEWGFTVVRREAPAPGSRSSVFSYLAPVDVQGGRDGGVLSFEADRWPIFPLVQNETREAYGRGSEHGTLVKLYEYRLPGAKSNILLRAGLLRRIDVGLPESALPIRLFECRRGYGGRDAASYSANAKGLAARLDRDKAEKLEHGFPIHGLIRVQGQAVRLRVYALTGNAKDYRERKYGVLFTLNGQTHASKSVDFFRRKSVGLSQIAESLIVVVDCSEIEPRRLEDLFMASRDRLRDSDLARVLERAVEAFLKGSGELRALRARRREQEITERLDDSKPLADALSDLVNSNPDLCRLLAVGPKIPSPFPTGGSPRGKDGPGGGFEAKRFPTYFRFKNKKDGEVLNREVGLGSKVRIAFETNAEDDYFTRDLDRGRAVIELRHDGGSWQENESSNLNGPRSGLVNLELEVPPGLTPGDVFEMRVQVTDTSRIAPFENLAELRVARKQSSQKGSGSRGVHANKAGPKKGSGPTTLKIPEIHKVHRAEWTKGARDFDELTAVQAIGNAVSDTGQYQYDFYVNVDNVFLRSAQKESRMDPRVLEAQFVYSLVLFSMGILSGDKLLPVDQRTDDGGQERLVASVTRMLARLVLPTLEVIGGIEEVE